MNSIDYYKAETDYRREQMQRDRSRLRAWRRVRPNTTSTRRREGASKIPLR